MPLYSSRHMLPLLMLATWLFFADSPVTPCHELFHDARKIYVHYAPRRLAFFYMLLVATRLLLLLLLLDASHAIARRCRHASLMIAAAATPAAAASDAAASPCYCRRRRCHGPVYAMPARQLAATPRQCQQRRLIDAAPPIFDGAARAITPRYGACAGHARRPPAVRRSSITLIKALPGQRFRCRRCRCFSFTLDFALCCCKQGGQRYVQVYQPAASLPAPRRKHARAHGQGRR